MFRAPLAAALFCAVSRAAPEAAYVGSRVCAACHAPVYAKFARTAMGRSVTEVSADAFPLPESIHSEALHRDFRVYARDGAVYESESGTEAGKQEFMTEAKLEYAVGSGANGVTFLVRRDDYLFEAPVSWYSKAGAWRLSPGYEQDDEGFSRPAYASCMVCHAGRARPVAGQDGRYMTPPFAEAAIGCENCHGPGSIHVREAQRGAVAAARSAIVNPARLPPRLAENICMLCHQGGGARVLLPGREYADIRAGAPLVRTVALARLASDSGGVLLEHHAGMEASRCFRASRGKLSCLSCHDPHQEPAPAEAAAYFRACCLACHSETSCRLPLATRRHTAPPDDCAGCHMPKRPAALISHSALTDHRIPARPDEAIELPPARPSPEGLPGVELLDAYPGEPELPLRTRLELCGELMTGSVELQARYLNLLDQAARELPRDPLVLAALGRKALASGQPDAIPLLETSLRRGGAPRQSTYIDLADAYTRAAQSPAVVPVLERAQQDFPYSKPIRKRLILAYIQTKNYAAARTALVSYVSDFPEDSFMRGLLRQVNPQ